MDRLVQEGFDATTTPGGAGERWHAEYAVPLTGATVVVIPDADTPGREHAQKVADGLVGIAAEVRILELPGLPDRGKDVSDWFDAGHTREELEKLIAEAPTYGKTPSAEILDDAPNTIKRPLCLIGDSAYAATWPYVSLNGETEQKLTIVRDDGQVFINAPVSGALPLSELGVDVSLPTMPPQDRCWSGPALKRYATKGRVDPHDVFDRACAVVDGFVDFRRSYGSQREMVELVACYILVTYFLDAFPVIGYLWSTGEYGSGKTTVLLVVAELAYLGQLILSGGTYATLRDLADYGATLAFDDAERIMDPRRGDPDKQALLLAGNRRGTYVTLKEQVGRQWVTRNVHAYCPRLFSAIRLPDSVLASRSILLPMVRSSDERKSRRDPMDERSWPHSRKVIVDDLWAVALANLRDVHDYDARVLDRTALIGRNLQPWRAVLAVALWLDEKGGVTGLFERMEALANRYQTERVEIEDVNPARLAAVALKGLMQQSMVDTITFTPGGLASEMNQIATDEDLPFTGESFTNPKKVGYLLKRLRLRRGSRTSKAKIWELNRAELNDLLLSYGVPELPPADDKVLKDDPAECRDAKDADCAVNTEHSTEETANDLAWGVAS
ncbi:MAG: hypothetical protein ISS31_08590 [Kiritimatiellae bacterium]|nr:hypothetical protein [Kiritimatiellia bacterium]